MLLVGGLPGAVRADEPRPAIAPSLERLRDAFHAQGEAGVRELLRSERRTRRSDGRVNVILRPRAGVAASIDRARLSRIGARVEAASRSLLRVSLPPEALDGLAELGDVREARLPLRFVQLDVGTGPIVTEAVALTGADLLQSQGIDGSGLKIAVVDASFAALSYVQSTLGELPPDTVGVDCRGPSSDCSDPFVIPPPEDLHGTSVAQLVADMAPGAQIYAMRVDDEVALQNAADYIASHGIRIANLSLAWFSASYYDDSGIISDIINDSHDLDGVFWAVASGNFAQRHWRGINKSFDASGWLKPTPTSNRIKTSTGGGGTFSVLLNWNQYGGLLTDLDLYVFDKFGTVVYPLVPPPITGMPYEESPYLTYDLSKAPYEIGIKRVSGPSSPLDVTVFCLGKDLDATYIVSAASFGDPAPAHGSFTVGGVHWTLWGDPNPPLISYSSRGPGTNPSLLKPDVVGPAETSVNNGSGSPGAVSGTSFTAPIVAGAAALLWQQDPNMTLAALEAELRSLAVDISPAGFDPNSGYGRVAVDLLQAFPNSDGDAFLDPFDNCPYTTNAGQEDVAGIAGAGPDGIGDVCQCGDTTGDGGVAAADVQQIRELLVGIGPLGQPQLCNAVGPADAGVSDCRLDDLVVIRRRLQALAPGIQPVCSPAIP